MSSLHWFSWRKRIKFYVVNLASQKVTCNPEGPGGSALLVATRVDQSQNVEKKKCPNCATHLLCQCHSWLLDLTWLLDCCWVMFNAGCFGSGRIPVALFRKNLRRLFLFLWVFVKHWPPDGNHWSAPVTCCNYLWKPAPPPLFLSLANIWGVVQLPGELSDICGETILSGNLKKGQL